MNLLIFFPYMLHVSFILHTHFLTVWDISIILNLYHFNSIECISWISGFGINRCLETGNVYIESVKAASLADRCGALHVGDILLGVNGYTISKLDVEKVSGVNFTANKISHVHLPKLNPCFWIIFLYKLISLKQTYED